MATFNLLAGTYSTGENESIIVYRFSTETGTLEYLDGIKGIVNPSYFCISADKSFVYAVNELDHTRPGAVTALSYQAKTGALRVINRQQTDPGPCYVSVDAARKHIFVANYAGGSLSVFPLAEDGSVLPAIQRIKNEGCGPDENRQDKSHIHAAVLSPDNGQVLFTDLGTDQIHIWNYRESGSEPLKPTGAQPLNVNPGHGPRHIDFTPDKRFMYLITEMGGAIYVYAYDGLDSKQLQTVNLAAEGSDAESGGADLHVSPDGKFLYATNRGDANEIVVFAIDAGTGLLTFVERTSSMGISPRNFVIDPCGHHLLVANEKSNDVYVFRIDKNSGKLTLTNTKINIDKPCCLKFTDS